MKLRLKELRLERKLSTTDLAEKAGVSRGYISLLENGQRQINAKMLEALSQAMNCSPVDIIGDGSLSPELRRHLEVMRQLSPTDRHAVMRHAAGLHNGDGE